MPLTDNSQFALNLPIQVRIIPRLLHFKNPAGTSRGIYLHHRVWYVLLTSPANHSLYGLGRSLSPIPMDLWGEAGGGGIRGAWDIS